MVKPVRIGVVAPASRIDPAVPAEVEALMWLVENVIGAANKRLVVQTE